jgi:hypothetical protein
MKGCKVSDAKRRRTVGVACQTLDELRRKGREKLNIEEDFRIELLDGTSVEDKDYFQTLPSQTVFLFLKPDENAPNGVVKLYKAFKHGNEDYLMAGTKARNFLTSNKEAVMRCVETIIQSETPNVQFSRKEEDPDWFEGIDSTSDTKEEYMRKKSEGRIRTYMKKTKFLVRKSDTYQNDQNCKGKLDEVFKIMNFKLEADNYFRGYFDRNDESQRLCDNVGNFICEGRWDVVECQRQEDVEFRHKINPYARKEARIGFAIWTFDHVIEIALKIVPALEKAARRASFNRRAINADYFYSLVCTTRNMKLVHTNCHDKDEHSIECDPTQFTATY